MRNIVNLTQHKSTLAQLLDGVFDIPDHNQGFLKELLTFEELPSRVEIESKAEALAVLAAGALDGVEEPCAMIGGAPYLMGALEEALRYAGIQPLYSFTKREVVESVKEDGSVEKTSVFKHVGFVEAS